MPIKDIPYLGPAIIQKYIEYLTSKQPEINRINRMRDADYPQSFVSHGDVYYWIPVEILP